MHVRSNAGRNSAVPLICDPFTMAQFQLLKELAFFAFSDHGMRDFVVAANACLTRGRQGGRGCKLTNMDSLT